MGGWRFGRAGLQVMLGKGRGQGLGCPVSIVCLFWDGLPPMVVVLPAVLSKGQGVRSPKRRVKRLPAGGCQSVGCMPQAEGDRMWYAATGLGAATGRVA